MYSKIIASFVITLVFISGCNRLPYTSAKDGELKRLDTTWAHTNAKIDALIAPYKAQIDSQMNVVVGYSATELIKARPESPMGNGIADLLYRFGVNTIGNDIDLCVMNYGGLRAPIPRGPITVGRIFEIMPFDNTLVVVTINQVELNQLAGHILVKGGEPFAGAEHVSVTNFKSGPRFVFTDSTLYTKQSYRILTSNYLADGGDSYTMFIGKQREETNTLIREALISGFSNTSNDNPFTAKIDGRIIWDPNRDE
ncbi:MAG: 2',3'-cyclic-nucleotide 2'-phosphodiesterase (5'-nucleotidase family) [Bacteroidia bacterium]